MTLLKQLIKVVR